jgi:hypothetical protein
MRKTSLSTLNISIIALFIVVILWGLNWYVGIKSPCFSNWSDRASFGDMFGVVSALFSGLAFAGIIITIFLQTKELALQRQELEDTRTEIRGQKDQLIIQNDDNKFFQLLTIHNQIIDGMLENKINHVGAVVELRGRNKIDDMYRKLKGKVEEKTRAGGDERQKIDILVMLFNDLQLDMDHYFRSLYNIVDFIENSSLRDKQFFSNIIRSQLSLSELCFVFYDCLLPGRERNKTLVEKYALLRDIPKIMIPLYTHYASLYNTTAFKT